MSRIKVEQNQEKPLQQKKIRHLLREDLPSMYDLPSEEVGESGLPDEFHVFQSQLLRETFQPENYSENEIFVGTDINLYFDETHTRWYRRPDWFASVGVSRLYNQTDLRLSYVVWQEGVKPLVVIELLSPSTEKEDLGQVFRDPLDPRDIPTKWEAYETILKVPFYFTYDHLTEQIRAFRLEGTSYIAFLPDKDGRFSLPSIKLSLGIWKGDYQGFNKPWLRWFDEQGNIVLTPLERKTQDNEQLAKDKEQLSKDKEQLSKDKDILLTKAERLAARLKELGIDPEEI